MPIKVIKRDGSKEDFDPEKISRVVQAAGLDKAQADVLAMTVQQKIVASSRQSLSSLVVRDLVIGELHHVDENAANLFTWYEKTKDGAPTIT